MEPRFSRPARVVVKVGSSSLRDPAGQLDRDMVGRLVDQLAAVRAEGTEIVLVSSGAVAAGLAPLGFDVRPTDLPGLQAAASVGQGLLMHTYQDDFARHGIACGQVLLTPEDVVHRGRYLNARHTFDRLLGLGAVPVVNENDTVGTDELRFGDNDRLAALVASMLGAQLLVLLSDVEGLLDGDPSRDPDLPVIDRVDDLARLDGVRWGGSSSGVGTGGMASKIEAVRIARSSAAHSVIAHARRADIVAQVIGGAHVGTWFPPSARRPESRKLWIAFAPQPQGAVTVDSGAVRALVDRGSSLLAAGVVDAEGPFSAGDAVDVRGPEGRTIARGLVAYGAEEVLRMCGRSTEQIVEELGSSYAGAVIHRDRLVVVA
jgi:glutamate 5-kinase